MPTSSARPLCAETAVALPRPLCSSVSMFDTSSSSNKRRFYSEDGCSCQEQTWPAGVMTPPHSCNSSVGDPYSSVKRRRQDEVCCGSRQSTLGDMFLPHALSSCRSCFTPASSFEDQSPSSILALSLLPTPVSSRSSRSEACLHSSSQHRALHASAKNRLCGVGGLIASCFAGRTGCRQRCDVERGSERIAGPSAPDANGLRTATR